MENEELAAIHFDTFAEIAVADEIETLPMDDENEPGNYEMEG
jgi:hypothetical protein